MKERAVTFGTAAPLVGILTSPVESVSTGKAPEIGVLLLNAGLLHRIGPSRLYVKLARFLARDGFHVLRFDFSGIGDSGRRRDTLTFEKSSNQEVSEAIDHMAAQTGLKRFLLIGLCSGALVSFCAAGQDPRVVGVVCINAPGFAHVIPDSIVAQVSKRQASRYYLQVALSNPASWLKILRGRVDYLSIGRALWNATFGRLQRSPKSSTKAAPDSKADSTDATQGMQAQLENFKQRGVRSLLLFSEGDWGLDYLHCELGKSVKQLEQFGAQLEVVTSADHIFTLRQNQRELMDRIRTWSLGLS